MVSLLKGGVHYCSGSYIKPLWILTTAHCISPSKLPFTTVKMGAENLSAYDSERKIEKAIQHALITHPKVERKLMNKTMGALNNVGLIKIPTPFTLGDTIQIIQIASRPSFYGGRVAETAGWGKLCLKDDPTDDLRLLRVPIARNNRQILYQRVAEGECLGDSGSSIVLDSKIIGLVVCGFRCGQLTGVLPSGFIEIYPHIDWIKNCTSRT